MSVEIKSIGGSVLYVAKDAKDVRAAVEDAVKNGAYLDGAYLAGAYLAGAYLAGAYLAGAYLDGANLVGANLAGANLAGANLVGANLDGANLDGANLDGANLDGARWAKVAKVLREAVAAMNDQGRHWIKGELARRLADGSQAYCSFGSVRAKADDGTVRALALWLLGSVCAGNIASFNDHPGTSWEDVQAVFGVAIRHAERLSV